MASSASRLSNAMDVQQKGKAILHQSPFVLAVNPTLSPLFGRSLESRSAQVFPSGLSDGHGASSQHEASQKEGIEIEFMFSKILTLSDVGKLNRLIIPRQEAEKFFPMSSVAISEDGASFLNFEDSTEKLWHFRYSFWWSSQSYVFTREWAKFVKEKRLNDGDIVSFYQRGNDATSINHRFIFFKKQDHGSSVPHHVPPTFNIPFGTLNDNWLFKAFGSTGHYRASLAHKHLSYGCMGKMPTNSPILQPPLVPRGERFPLTLINMQSDAERWASRGTTSLLGHPSATGLPSNERQREPNPPQEAPLGSGMKPAKKRVRLFGIDLVPSGNESFYAHGHTNDAA